VYRLNLLTFHWELIHCRGEPPIYRDFHSATAIGHYMFIFGGRSDLSGGFPGQVQGAEFYTNKVHYLDTRKLQWHSPAVESRSVTSCPEGRRSHSAVELDGGLLIFGGFNGLSEKHFDDLWLLSAERQDACAPSEPPWRWTRLRPAGRSPGTRRRQAMCRVRDQILLFGGTSPYHGPPILFTEAQQMLMPEHEPSHKLIDHNDLYVLDLKPSLRTLCLLAIGEYGLSVRDLPQNLQMEYKNATSPNKISARLKTLTLPLG